MEDARNRVSHSQNLAQTLNMGRQGEFHTLIISLVDLTRQAFPAF